MAIESDAFETPMHENTQGDRYAILENEYEVEYDQQKEPDKKQVIELILTHQYINMYGCVMLYTLGGNMDVDEMQKK